VILPCSGRVEELMLLQAFEKGADGVMVVGCLEGDCHYLSGNLRARARVKRVAGILDQVNLGGERVGMFNLSAGEGTKFVQYANQMVEKIRALGPSPVNRTRRRRKAS
jgi:F420-non-reducing hydrogenase iron-sulfur subunit